MRLELPASKGEHGQTSSRSTARTSLFYKMSDIEDAQLVYSVQAIAESRLL